MILINPDGFGTGTEGTIDRYVAMTRATQQLIILTSPASGLTLDTESHSI